MSDATQTITVPHLGGSDVGYAFGRPYDGALPTLVMVNSFTTTVELYRHGERFTSHVHMDAYQKIIEQLQPRRTPVAGGTA